MALLAALGVVGLAGPRGTGPRPASAEEPGAVAATIHLLGARVRPLKPDGKAWDGDHRRIPPLAYVMLGAATGMPGVALLGLVPYRNRPDPYARVLDGERELGRTPTVQGSFSPAWTLRVDLRGDPLPDVLTVRVLDDDLTADDGIGSAVLATKDLLARPGTHTVEGTGGLVDVLLVVHRPPTPADPVVRLRLEGLDVAVRKHRPAGGDWDVGGNPVASRFPRVPGVGDLEGLESARPDLLVRASWLGGGERVSPLAENAFALSWSELGWDVEGREGTGDGLLLAVVDRDAAVDDPVGVLYVPLASFTAAKERGVLDLEPDRLNGVERVTVRFRLESD